MKQTVEVLKNRVKRLEEKVDKKSNWPKREERREEENEIKILRKSMEKLIEEGEREKRRRNVIVKGIKIGGREVSGVIENFWKDKQSRYKKQEQYQ